MVNALKQIIPKFKTPKKGKSKVPVTLRSHKDERAYTIRKKHRKPRDLLTEKRIKEWKSWVLIDAAFPYTIAFKTHHMLIPKREVNRQDLNPVELSELNLILDELSDDYDCSIVNFLSKQSITNHYHIHVLQYKDDRSEMRL